MAAAVVKPNLTDEWLGKKSFTNLFNQDASMASCRIQMLWAQKHGDQQILDTVILPREPLPMSDQAFLLNHYNPSIANASEGALDRVWDDPRARYGVFAGVGILNKPEKGGACFQHVCVELFS